MSKTVVGKEYTNTVDWLKKYVEPALHKVITTANLVLNKRGIRVGGEIQWFIERIDNEEEKKSTGG